MEFLTYRSSIILFANFVNHFESILKEQERFAHIRVFKYISFVHILLGKLIMMLMMHKHFLIRVF
jgi:hypothetical protein